MTTSFKPLETPAAKQLAKLLVVDGKRGPYLRLAHDAGWTPVGDKGVFRSPDKSIEYMQGRQVGGKGTQVKSHYHKAHVRAVASTKNDTP